MSGKALQQGDRRRGIDRTKAGSPNCPPWTAAASTTGQISAAGAGGMRANSRVWLSGLETHRRTLRRLPRAERHVVHDNTGWQAAAEYLNSELTTTEPATGQGSSVERELGCPVCEERMRALDRWIWRRGGPAAGAGMHEQVSCRHGQRTRRVAVRSRAAGGAQKLSCDLCKWRRGVCPATQAPTILTGVKSSSGARWTSSCRLLAHPAQSRVHVPAAAPCALLVPGPPTVNRPRSHPPLLVHMHPPAKTPPMLSPMGRQRQFNHRCSTDLRPPVHGVDALSMPGISRSPYAGLGGKGELPISLAYLKGPQPHVGLDVDNRCFFAVVGISLSRESLREPPAFSCLVVDLSQALLSASVPHKVRTMQAQPRPRSRHVSHAEAYRSASSAAPPPSGSQGKRPALPGLCP
ncbi:hypothetical protein Micbo1qcDRAFT_176027 [Microdochium bolleyi]|uniref:Uncharacterized protein n=1 Tax=Microdochium bolleyi TaxID=196109 RepID=A0A136J1H0_9PEZI|nr:hypothetical protein Micbo1qcDRAFT_176027 [Microdochium bolleyi]